MRHWDGSRWTGHTAQAGSVEPARQLTSGDAERPGIFQKGDRGLIAIGIFMSVLFPLGGLIVGIRLLFKERVGPGLGCVLLSALMMLVSYVLLTG